MPYPDDHRQPRLSAGRPCGDAAGITTSPVPADAGGITAPAAGSGAPVATAAWAWVNTTVRTGIDQADAGGAVTAGARFTSPGARGGAPRLRLRRAWPDNAQPQPGEWGWRWL